MKKSYKALLASGAAIVVLTGGAGSLAFWNATATVNAGAIQSGRLDLEALAGAAWKLNGAAVANPTAVRLVPGDVLTYAGSYTIHATGDNIKADVTVSGAEEGATDELAPYLDTSLSYTVNGTPSTSTIDASNNLQTLAVNIRADFGFGSVVQNLSQRKQLDLSNVSVVLTQTDATP